MRRFVVTVYALDLRDGDPADGLVAHFNVEAEHVSMLFEPSIAAKLREPERSTHRVHFPTIGGTFTVQASDERDAVRQAQRMAVEGGEQNINLAHYEIEEL